MPDTITNPALIGRSPDEVRTKTREPLARSFDAIANADFDLVVNKVADLIESAVNNRAEAWQLLEALRVSSDPFAAEFVERVETEVAAMDYERHLAR